MSVNQMECTTRGIIVKLKGRLTTSQYKFATIFVDYHSQLGFVYLKRTSDGVESIKAKIVWEAYCADHSIKVRHYHADNGRFCKNLFMNDVKEKR